MTPARPVLQPSIGDSAAEPGPERVPLDCATTKLESSCKNSEEPTPPEMTRSRGAYFVRNNAPFLAD